MKDSIQVKFVEDANARALKGLEQKISHINKQQEPQKYDRAYEEYKQMFKKTHGVFPGEEVADVSML